MDALLAAKAALVAASPVSPAEPSPRPGAAAGAQAGNATDSAGQTVTPWEVDAGEDGAVDYAKLVRDFGCQEIDGALIARLERATGRPAHPMLRRGLFFAHRDLERVVAAHERGEPIYLYTGRGPSSEALHLGHLVPFLFTAWLQEALGCPLVVQLTDDEKCLWKGLDQAGGAALLRRASRAAPHLHLSTPCPSLSSLPCALCRTRRFD